MDSNSRIYPRDRRGREVSGGFGTHVEGRIVAHRELGRAGFGLSSLAAESPDMTGTPDDLRVAIVKITRDRRDEVLRTLRILTILPENPRIVVVDNTSGDGTAGAVTARFPEVLVVESGSNLGAAARTLVVRLVNAPYVAFCDDDTWWDPGCLSVAADLLDAHPRLAVVNARVLVGSEDREDSVCTTLAHSPLAREPGTPGPPRLGFLAGTSVVRRSAYLAAGGFEPRFFIGGEEGLLTVDLATQGWWVCYVAGLVVHHQPSARRNAASRRNTIARNALWFAWLRRPLRVALRKTVSAAAARPLAWETWETLAEVLAGLPWVLRRRSVPPPEVEKALRLLELHSDVLLH